MCIIGPIFDEVQWSLDEAVLRASLRYGSGVVPNATENDELHRAEREGIVRGALDSPVANEE